MTQNLSSGATAGGRGGGGRGGFGGPGGFGGRGGRFGGGRGTNVSLNGQLQWRRNTTEALNVFPDLGGETTNTSISAPITLNVQRGRSIQNFNVNITHTSATTTNAFAGTQNVAGDAGIQYPSAASTDPANWGVPNLTFSGFTGVRGAAASERQRHPADHRLYVDSSGRAPPAAHGRRLPARLVFEPNQLERARDVHIHRPVLVRRGGNRLDAPAPTSPISCSGCRSRRRCRSEARADCVSAAFDAYIEDNWQKNAKLTFNLGLRYELAVPYVEVDGRMANLDVDAGPSRRPCR